MEIARSCVSWFSGTCSCKILPHSRTLQKHRPFAVVVLSSEARCVKHAGPTFRLLAQLLFLNAPIGALLVCGRRVRRFTRVRFEAVFWLRGCGWLTDQRWRVGDDDGQMDFGFGIGRGILHNVCVCAAVDQDLAARRAGFVLWNVGALFVGSDPVAGVWRVDTR